MRLLMREGKCPEAGRENIMRYEWMDTYLLQKRGVTKDLQETWNWIRYHVGGKMFAAICLGADGKPYYINLKLEPAEGEFFRTQYEDIIPGYYSDKLHWNSIKPDGEVPDELLKGMLDKSYRLVLSGFSKKKQREILGLSCCGTECAACGYYGTMCQGCNELQGRVFHAPEGKPCPIYACAVRKKRMVNCAECDILPCSIWQETKDPQLSENAFQKSIENRINNLRSDKKHGI
ncbi:hypothetical protein BRYFOR_07339 [Marvinbryantia formatexigens DSM 14469]|uniref:DUF3795 domain-containing protein n=2 Tax=Marvinbryantia TaxID=248744 RepID=C6LFD7_9FIRM|nr:hypothetical protein BRYFOR_07339 [Marvinbryantia formatexigens DSM 14469]